ncbi:hypothetical protein C5U62_20300 [Pseudomonas protegens]|uniref:Uncharacterized protein n=1 Tax=Pseudomonas protegens TaxID=380021 RepID=A0A2T6GJF7_9PSED|nr:hypothetical protein C5U62_20300 [Pseudomonas protegens]
MKISSTTSTTCAFDLSLAGGEFYSVTRCCQHLFLTAFDRDDRIVNKAKARCHNLHERRSTPAMKPGHYSSNRTMTLTSRDQRTHRRHQVSKKRSRSLAKQKATTDLDTGGDYKKEGILEKDGVPGQVRTANLPLRRVIRGAGPLGQTQCLLGFASGCVRKNDAV